MTARWTAGTIGDEPALWWDDDTDEPALTVDVMPFAGDAIPALTALAADVTLARSIENPTDDLIDTLQDAVWLSTDPGVLCTAEARQIVHAVLATLTDTGGAS